jgi:hypothetical protein
MRKGVKIKLTVLFLNNFSTPLRGYSKKSIDQ